MLIDIDGTYLCGDDETKNDTDGYLNPQMALRHWW
jgi:hypothetical protein